MVPDKKDCVKKNPEIFLSLLEVESFWQSFEDLSALPLDQIVCRRSPSIHCLRLQFEYLRKQLVCIVDSARNVCVGVHAKHVRLVSQWQQFDVFEVTLQVADCRGFVFFR